MANNTETKMEKLTRNKRIKDIVRRKQSEGDERRLYVNKYFNKPEAYDIEDGKVMLVGKVIDSDWDMMDFEPLAAPTPVPSNYRFFNTNGKPIAVLNDLMDQVCIE